MADKKKYTYDGKTYTVCTESEATHCTYGQPGGGDTPVFPKNDFHGSIAEIGTKHGDISASSEMGEAALWAMEQPITYLKE